MADSVGVDRRTGKILTDWEHVVSSLEDLLTTRKLSRVMLRQYGSDFPKLIDAPMTEVSLVLFYSAVATAVALWEPRVELSQVTFVEADQEGRAALQMIVEYMPRGHLGDRTVASTRTADFVNIGGAFTALS